MNVGKYICMYVYMQHKKARLVPQDLSLYTLDVLVCVYVCMYIHWLQGMSQAIYNSDQNVWV